MQEPWVESVDKLVRNRFPESDKAFLEYVEGLDEVAVYLNSKKNIDNISAFISAIVKVFVEENITESYIASVEGLIYGLADIGYINYLRLFSELTDNLDYFNSKAFGWGAEMLFFIFYRLEQESISTEEIASIVDKKDNKLKAILKEFILKMDLENALIEVKAFADKCLAILG